MTTTPPPVPPPSVPPQPRPLSSSAASRTQPIIRPAEAADLPFLPDIEHAAGEAFRGVGMARIADDGALPRAVLAGYQHAGRAWVASSPRPAAGAAPIAYLLLDVVDGNAHVEQVTVHPDSAGAGIGARLIDAVDEWAREAGFPALTLTTFEEVPWNAPYYRRLGFSILAPSAWGPELAAVRRHEADAGLDAWPRVAMVRPVQPVQPRHP
ncbi:GNAT family N-acetyltransferase [Arthrobacter bussei]|uniref:GNAT family N-acetyltransferase n=1 Tax=Arthrobacter bussei TaxID=2594179 RepID=UPI00128BDFAC|nr:GNAT family N-acetyltransferase [Arthrobacter bussei]